MVVAVFQGGPYDGAQLALIGGTPSYLMLLDPPPGAGWSGPLIVGAGFDDAWPGQQRYDLTSETGGRLTYTHTTEGTE